MSAVAKQKELNDVSQGQKADPFNLKEAYRQMLLIRRFEERSAQLYGMGLIAGFCHLYIGQEAVVVGLQMLAQEHDSIITAYRDHGHMLACNMDPRGVMAELTGRADGYSKGKGGSMHMFSREKNFFGGHGIVGAQVPLGSGLAFAHKYKEDGGISFTYMGEGASNQGQVYEAFNMAALWKLPALYVIENNHYSMGTSSKRHTANTEFHKRGSHFGIPGARVDGMDVFAVYEAGKRAVEHVRSGKGPFVLEVDTYRYRGHSMSDPAQYRSKEEVEKVRGERDPIETFKGTILEKKLVSEAALKKIDQEVKEIMLEVVAFAKESPEPDPSELYTDIYVEGEAE